MPTVHLPTPLRPLAGGAATVEVEGATIGELIDALEARHPGIRERLIHDGRLRGSIAVFINDQAPLGGLQARVPPDASVYLAPAIAGG